MADMDSLDLAPSGVRRPMHEVDTSRRATAARWDSKRALDEALQELRAAMATTLPGAPLREEPGSVASLREPSNRAAPGQTSADMASDRITAAAAAAPVMPHAAPSVSTGETPLPGRRTGFVPVVAAPHEQGAAQMPARAKRSGRTLRVALALAAVTALAVTTTIVVMHLGDRGPGEAERLLKQVSQIMPVPAGTPSVMQLHELTAAPDDPFFAEAHPDDWLLLFADGQTAILYREATNSVINLAHLTFAMTEAS